MQNWNKELSSWGYTRPAQEFWATAIATVKQAYPGTLFLAEVYNNQACSPRCALRRRCCACAIATASSSGMFPRF
jgi:hypothetical protein